MVSVITGLIFFITVGAAGRMVDAAENKADKTITLDKDKWKIQVVTETDSGTKRSKEHDLTTTESYYEGFNKAFINSDGDSISVSLPGSSNGSPGGGRSIVDAEIKQSIFLEANRYYQIKGKTRMRYSPTYTDRNISMTNIIVDNNYHYFIFYHLSHSYLDKTMNNVVTMKSNESKNYLIGFSFRKPLNAVVSTNTSVPYYTNWILSDFGVTDVTDDFLKLTASIDGLFTSRDQNALKLSTSQQKVDNLKQDVENFSNVLTETDKKKLEEKLTKAQTILDKIQMTLKIQALVDNHLQEASYKITGTTYPNSFLSFSGSPALAEGELNSEVEGDLTRYQTRADSVGKFAYELPKGKYFEAGEEILIKSMLQGKTLTITSKVKDTTPPDPPQLNEVIDKSITFSGHSEANATINVYEKGNQSIFLTGQADAEGQFDISIPKAQQPLVPYKNYEVIALDSSGNKSVASNLQQVKDTTPPTAEAVIQQVKINASVPSISMLLKNIYDNAGIEDITMEMIKQPDLTKVGRTTATIELLDKAKNKTIIDVQFLVESSDTMKDDTYMLYGETFSTLAVDYPETEAEQIQFILEQSKANAWEIATSKEKKELILIDKTLVKRAVGTYEVSFSIGKITKKINITLLPGMLTIKNFSSNVSFGEPAIQSRKQKIVQEKAVELKIEDTRFNKNQWRLTAQLESHFQNTHGEDESGLNLYVREEKNKEIPINKQGTNEVFSSGGDTGREVTVSFTNTSRSLILETVPGKIRSNTVYAAKINWLLENGP
ncbi:hypothetical protein RV12_GL000935 [Enterococcus quebecensis]|nr:hypothetical protein RV12_GL000935 [Enterococcus quebecensis]